MPRPQSRAVPVTVISGFLGAGKTTVLNHILRADHGLRIAVMVNDFGELDIDSQTIVSVEEQVYSLANGCICCTVQNDLLEQVVGLMRRKQDAPDYILIETSGVSDPIRVVHTLQYPQLRGLVTVDGVICVVDAEQFGSLSPDMARLAMDQLDAADIILINKTDLVSLPDLDALKQAWLYPGAKIFETSFGQVPVELLVTIDSLQPARHQLQSQLIGSGRATNLRLKVMPCATRMMLPLIPGAGLEPARSRSSVCAPCSRRCQRASSVPRGSSMLMRCPSAAQRCIWSAAGWT